MAEGRDCALVSSVASCRSHGRLTEAICSRSQSPIILSAVGDMVSSIRA